MLGWTWYRGTGSVACLFPTHAQTLIVMATFAGRKDTINPQDTNAFSAIAQNAKAPSTGNQAAEACEVTVDTLKNIVMISRKVLAKPGNTKLYGKMAIVLGGIGSQWKSMGAKLVYFSAIFRNTIARLAQTIKAVDPDFPDLTDLFLDGTKWHLKRYMGIGIVSYQIGVINLFKTAGIKPDYIIGHSIGETSAGYLAGLTTEKETILIQLVQSRMCTMIRAGYHLLVRPTRIANPDLAAIVEELVLPDETGNFYYYIPNGHVEKFSGIQGVLHDLSGKMSYCGLSKKEIEATIEELGLEQVVVGCCNSPHGQTISGSAKEVDTLYHHLTKIFEDRKDGTKLFWRDLDTDNIAYHSPVFSVFHDWLVVQFKQILTQSGKKASKNERIDSYGWISSSSDNSDNSAVVFDAAYHAQTIVSNVKFQRCIEYLSVLESANCLVLEIGSSSSLLGQVKRIDNQLGTLGFVKHGSKNDESKYLDRNALRISIFRSGHVHAFHKFSPRLEKCKEDRFFSNNDNFSTTVKELNKVLDDLEFLEKEMSFRISDVQRALNSIVKASKPREKIVSHILKRAWVRCACDPSSNVPILLPLVKAFSKKRNDFYSKDSPMILHAGNIVRLFEL